MLNIDIPIALGIIVMFVRSTLISSDYGSGFFDSLTGLIFLCSLANVPNKKTYSLSFGKRF
jgi:Cu+-exporting ATPase